MKKCLSSQVRLADEERICTGMQISSTYFSLMMVVLLPVGAKLSSVASGSRKERYCLSTLDEIQLYHCLVSREAVLFYIVEAGTMITNNKKNKNANLITALSTYQDKDPFTFFFKKDDAAMYQCSVLQIHLLCFLARFVISRP